MFDLDNRTILYAQVFLGVITVFYSFFPSRVKNKKSMVLFRLANIMYLSGFLLLMLQGILPKSFTMMLANLLILAAFALFSFTAAEIYKRPLPYGFIHILIIIHTILFFYYIYIIPNTLMRIIIISFEIFIIQAWSLWKILHKQKMEKTAIFKMLIFTLSSYMITLALRVFITLMLNKNIDSILNIDLASSLILFSTLAFHLSMNLVIIISLIQNYESQAVLRANILEQTHKDILDLNSLHLKADFQENQEELHGKICDFFEKNFKAAASGIYLIDSDRKQVKLIYEEGFPEGYKEKIRTLSLQSYSIISEAMIENRAVFKKIEDFPESEIKSILNKNGFTEMAAYPIHSSSSINGAFTLIFNEEKLLLKEIPNVFNHACHQVSVIMENATLYKELNSQATTDPLTNIANRRNLLENLSDEFSRSKRYQRPLSLLMMDIDHFKYINDSYGHDAGDFILKDLVRIVNAELRKEDFFGRYGGEEFIITLSETSRREAMELAERIRKKAELSVFTFREHTIRLTVSMGACQILDSDREYEQMITRSDEALYKAKKSGRNRCVFSELI